MASDIRTLWSPKVVARWAPQGVRLDAVVTVLSLWLTAGVAWDFSIHAHGIDFAEEGFFTASHITFYSAFIAIAAVIGLSTYANYRRGAGLWTAIPRGYRLGVLGVGIFALAGPADFLWHSAFGFEVGVEALTSPSHLLLVVGGTLFLSSPLRAAWVRTGSPRGINQVPALVSATFVGVGVSYFTIYSNPLVQPLGAPGGPTPEHAFLGFLWFGAVLAGLVLVLVRRFRLAPGALTLVVGLLGLFLVIVAPSPELWPAAVAAGLLADGLVWRSRDGWSPARRLRVLAAAVPSALFAGYFGTVWALYGLAWPVHIWTGAIVSTGLVGLLMSYLVAPHPGGDGDQGLETNPG